MISEIKKFLGYKMVLFCVLLLSAFILMGIFSNFIAPYNPIETDLAQNCMPPSLAHPFGTDELGRDILSRVIYGAKLTLTIAFAATAIGGTIGILSGALSGFYGGAIDLILQRFTDVLLALPGLLLAIMFVAIMGNNLSTVIASVALSMIPSYIRMTRGLTLQVKELEYVLAAKQLGVKNFKVMIRHIIPNISPTIIAQVTLNLGTSILFASGLGFLGIGIPPPQPEWGTMLGTGRTYMFYAPHIIIFPGIAIFLVVFSFNKIGDRIGEIIAVK
jgi:ABC-type dipeptide/oligopeptide/nickel transport system permease subunit